MEYIEILILGLETYLLLPSFDNMFETNVSKMKFEKMNTFGILQK